MTVGGLSVVGFAFIDLFIKVDCLELLHIHLCKALIWIVNLFSKVILATIHLLVYLFIISFLLVKINNSVIAIVDIDDIQLAT